MNDKSINIAVVGSGYWGKNLVRNFHQIGALKLICDKNEETVQQFNEQYPGVDTSTHFEDIINRSDLHAVAIATPAETHFELATQCLDAGKHTFIEKPLALTEQQGLKLVQLADKSNLTLMVGHILQYHSAVIKLKELIDEGELGKIQYLYSNRLNIGKIRAEENILWSFAPHDISVILMLLGKMPETVYATGGNYLQKQIPDSTLTVLDFDDGVKAHIFVSWLHPYKEQKLVVVGDKKMAVFDDITREKLFLYPHEIKWLDRIPVASKAEAEIVTLDMGEPLKAECLHFLECVATGKRPKTDGREGLRVLQVLQASQASIDRKGSNIYFPHSNQGKTNYRSVFTEDSPKQTNKKTEEYVIHESAYVDHDVKIGPETKIWHFSHVLSGSRIGRNCNIGQNVVIGPETVVGNNCKIQNNVSVFKGVTLEDGVFCGPSMVFTNVYNPRAEIRKMDQLRPTLVKKGATLGANCTIVCGVTIGRYAFVGAGAVVTKDVPDHALVVGNPSTIAGWMCGCGEKLNDQLICRACSNKYRSKKNGLVTV